MKISIIAAVARNRVIGIQNGLPWHLPADFKYFKSVTMSKPVMMGDRTYESIGKPLPGRKNIVVTLIDDYEAEGCTVVHSLDDAVAEAAEADELMVMGGASIYKQMLERADRLYITEVHTDVDGDAVFPAIDASTWHEVSREDHKADEKNEHDYSFVVYERRAGSGS